MARFRIIYEDDALIVVDKPTGMLVIPAPKKELNTLTGLLNEELDSRGLQVNAYPCHRLDRETSGLIIYAKGKHFQKLVMDEFRKQAVKKIYVAFVHGAVRKDSDIIKGYIYNAKTKRRETAITKYNVLERKKDFSILEVEPITGRTNQIRIQLKELGHPLVGESVYAFRKDFKLRFKRVALHAKYIEFNHPATKERLKFTSPLPKDMQHFLNKHIGTDMLPNRL